MNKNDFKNLIRLVPPVGLLQHVAVLEKATELEILGIKFRNGFNVEVPCDVLHTHPVRFFIFSDDGMSRACPPVSGRRPVIVPFFHK